MKISICCLFIFSHTLFGQISINDMANDNYDGDGIMTLIKAFCGIGGVVFIALGAIKGFSGGFEDGGKNYFIAGLVAFILLAVMYST